MTRSPSTLLQLMSHPRDIYTLLADYVSQIQDGGHTGLSSEQKDGLLHNLPRIAELQLIKLGEKDSSCPICFTSYLAIIAEEEMAIVMDSPAHASEHLGVTKLSQPWQCGHMFCRKDITKWIADGHDSCPLCRRLLIENKNQGQDRPSSDNAEGTAPTPSTDSRSTALINQIRELLNSDETIPPNLDFDQDMSSQRGDRGEQAREYSGMFS